MVCSMKKGISLKFVFVKALSLLHILINKLFWIFYAFGSGQTSLLVILATWLSKPLWYEVLKFKVVYFDPVQTLNSCTMHENRTHCIMQCFYWPGCVEGKWLTSLLLVTTRTLALSFWGVTVLASSVNLGMSMWSVLSSSWSFQFGWP